MKWLLLIGLLGGPVRLLAFMRTVGVHRAYPTIQAALAAADNGDTILVYPGIYHEGNLAIRKPVVMKGVDYPVLDGDRRFEIISVYAPGTVIDGLLLRNSGVSSLEDFAGIKIYNIGFVQLLNNRLQNCFFGIYLQYAHHIVIRNNQLAASAKQEQQSGNGIHCWKSDSLQIISNSITGHRDGIYFEFVTHSVIWRNHAYRNLRYGLHFMFSNNDLYAMNRFEQNGAGVAVMYSNHVRMMSNYFRENWGDAAYGILLKEISDSHIQGNHFERNTSGILMEGTSRIDVLRNTFLDNGWALKIQASCMDIVLEHNRFVSNSFDVGTNGSLVLNRFHQNYWDKYEGYDLNRDGIGDVPYRPVSLFGMIAERNPPAMLLYRSFISLLMDRTEKVLPALIPENLKDDAPLMKPGEP